MPRLTEVRRQDRHDLLLEAARAAFAEHGFEGASISAIARTAGVSDGLIYRYFSDKRALLSAVLEKFVSDIIAQAEVAVAKEKTFAARLERLIAAQLQAYADEPALCRLYICELRAAADYLGSPLHGLTKRYTDLVVRIIKAAVKAKELRADVDPRMVRDMVFGSIEHIAWRSLFSEGALEVRKAARDMTRLFTWGMERRVD
jgi:AcrR family transcriptional regulator